MKKQKKVPLLFKVMGIFVIFAITWSTSKMIYLKHYGKETSGIVQSIIPVGSKGKLLSEYTYYIDGIRFHGEIHYKDFQVGESINVLYISNYPSISAPEKFIEKNYGLKSR